MKIVNRISQNIEMPPSIYDLRNKFLTNKDTLIFKRQLKSNEQAIIVQLKGNYNSIKSQLSFNCHLLR